MPRVEVFYAAKANSDDVIIKKVIENGGGFDVASGAEIKQVVELGAQPERLVFANPIKTRAHLETAKKYNVKKMTFDSVEELYKIKTYFPEAEVVLRIAITVATDAMWDLNEKYGAHMRLVPDMIATCKKLGLRLVGVSFHVGCGGVSLAPYIDCLENARRIFDMAEEAGLAPCTFLDIGGGFSMLAPTPERNFEHVADRIAKRIDELFPDPSVQVIGEPGTQINESCVYMVSQVIGTKTEDDGRHYIINNSLHKGYMMRMLGVVHPLEPLEPKAGRRSFKSVVWGQTCDVTDQITEERMLPEMKLGEWVISRDMGAYCSNLNNQMGGFKDPDRKSVV